MRRLSRANPVCIVSFSASMNGGRPHPPLTRSRAVSKLDKVGDRCVLLVRPVIVTCDGLTSTDYIAPCQQIRHAVETDACRNNE